MTDNILKQKSTTIYSKTLSYYAVILLLMLSSVFYLITALNWLNKPFAGFLVYQNLVITDAVPGITYENDLKRFKDRVLELNGIKINSPDQMYKIVRNLPVGSNVEYTISRNGSSFTVNIPTRIFTITDFLSMFGVIYCVGLILLILGVSVKYIKPNLDASNAFFLFCIAIGLWFIGSFDAQATHHIDKLTFFSWIMSPVFGIYMILIFPYRYNISQKTLNTIVLTLLLISSALFISHTIYFNSFQVWKIINTLSWIIVLLGAACLPISSLYTLLYTSSSLDKQRAQIILLGGFFGLFLPALAAICITVLKINLPFNIMALPVIIFPLSIAYAIVKHKLFNIDVILEKTLTYGLLTGTVGGVFALMVLTFNIAFARHGGWKNPAFFLILSSFLVLALNPLKNRIQDLVDLTFFRKKFDYRGTVEEVSYAMTSLLSLDKIVDKIINIIERTMFSNPVTVAIYNQNKGIYETYSKDITIQDSTKAGLDQENVLVDHMNKFGKEIFKEDLIADEKYIRDSEKLMREFKTFSGCLCMPLFFKKQLIGFIILGEKKSGLSYTSRDIKLLRLLANQSAIAIENALAFKLVEDYAKKLEKSNRELKDTQTQLVHAEKMSAIGQLAAGVAHEIRNPLNIIEGARYYLSNHMTNASDTEEVGEYLDYIKHEIDRTNKLIDSLLKFSKSELPRFESVEINSILKNVIVLMRKQLSDNNVLLTTNFNESIPPIMADSNQIWQVLINIIVNAVQAMPNGGKLLIETSDAPENLQDRKPGHIYIKFRDNGVGIDREELIKIFDPFYTKKDMGTGLGLSIAYKIIEEHKGNIYVSSEKGKGTLFTIELPIENKHDVI